MTKKSTVKVEEDTMKKIVYQKVLFVPDIHAPFHDKKWLAALLLFIKFFKPTTMFIMGDCVDFYAVSRFMKNPLRALKLQDEIDQAHKILKQIRDNAKDSKIIFIRGNHEARLQKYLWTTAKELAGLRSMSVEELLELEELGIEYAEQGYYNFNGLKIKHGSVVRKFSCYTAKAEFEKHGKSGVSGHTHRGGVYFQNNDSGNYVWMECGCGCSLKVDYMEGEVPNWQQGWGVGYFKKGSKRFKLEFIPFVSGKASYQGKEF